MGKTPFPLLQEVPPEQLPHSKREVLSPHPSLLLHPLEAQEPALPPAGSGGHSQAQHSAFPLLTRRQNSVVESTCVMPYFKFGGPNVIHTLAVASFGAEFVP